MNDSPSMTPTPVTGNRFRVLRCPSCNLMESSNFSPKAKGYIQCRTCGASFYDPQERNETQPPSHRGV